MNSVFSKQCKFSIFTCIMYHYIVSVVTNIQTESDITQQNWNFFQVSIRDSSTWIPVDTMTLAQEINDSQQREQ